MCRDCDCGTANEGGNRSSHLVVEDLKTMADTDGTSMSQVLANISQAAGRDRFEHPDEWA